MILNHPRLVLALAPTTELLIGVPGDGALAVVDGATVTACDPVKPNWDVDPSVYTHGCKQTRVTHGTNGESAPDDVLERVLAALAAPDESTRLAACACCDSKGARCDEF